MEAILGGSIFLALGCVLIATASAAGAAYGRASRFLRLGSGENVEWLTRVSHQIIGWMLIGGVLVGLIAFLLIAIVG